MSPSQEKGAGEIQAWLVTRLEKELDLVPGKLDVTKPVSRYGLDSIVAVTLAADLEDWLERPIPPGILAEYPSIEAIARHLASSTTAATCDDTSGPAAAPGTPPRALKTRGVNPLRWTPVQRVVRRILAFLAGLMLRLECENPAQFPSAGAYVLAMNHLHVIDAPILFAILPRPAVFLVSSHMKSFWIAKWFLSHVAHTVWISRGEGDVQAIETALAVLRAGGMLVMAPEGRISRTGGLLKGRTGAAYLAGMAGVPVLPVVAWGQERAVRNWLRLRRTLVSVRVGQPLDPPQNQLSSRQLEDATDRIMASLARLLPEAYRGEYREATTQSGQE